MILRGSTDRVGTPSDSSLILRFAPARWFGASWRAAMLDALIAMTLFLLACWQYFALVEERPFHRDEARWVHRGSYVSELADPFSSYWDEQAWIEQGGSFDERYRLRAQPPLGSYLIGVGMLLQGRDVNTNGFWNMDQGDDWNIARGNMPAPADLTAARRTVAVVSALTVAAIYAIGRRLSNRVGGVVAALAFTLHPLVNLYAAFAGSDMLLVLLVALAAIAGYRLADQPSWQRAVLLGVLLGLGGATKLSPLGVAAGLALCGGLIVLMHALNTHFNAASESSSSSGGVMAGSGNLWSQVRTTMVGQRTAALGWQLLSVPVVAIVTFVAVYPYLWRSPIDHTLALFEYRQTGMEWQAAIWDHVAVDTPAEALRRVGTRLGDEFTVLGRLATELQEHFGAGVSWNPGGIELGVAVIGLLVFLALVLQRGFTSGAGLVFAVLAGQAAVTIIGMEVDWARYHLPILLFLVGCIGVAAGEGWRYASRVVHLGFKRAWHRAPGI